MLLTFYRLLWFSQAFGINIVCNFYECPPIYRGDGTCHISCMAPYCNFDMQEFYQATKDPTKSDCLLEEPCHLFSNYQCLDEWLGDGTCNEECNVPSCGYDFGDCGYCASSCKSHLGFQSQLGGTCDTECNTTSCYYDAGACLECSVGCNSTIWGNGICDQECNNKECNYDNGDCSNITCAPNCYNWMLNNSICDEACHVEECGFDYFDCDCSPGCFSYLLENDECDEICNNLACEYDKGDCGYCASGCFLDMLVNDICEEVCNNFACKYDYYACKCADDCLAEDYGKCKLECLVMDCKYDQIGNDPTKRCNNTNLVLYSLIQQTINQDFDILVNFDSCLETSSSQCSLSMSVDSESCYSECFYKECNYGLCNFYTDCYSLPLDAQAICDICQGEALFTCIWFGTGQLLFMLGLGIQYNSKWLTAGLPDFNIFYATSRQVGSSPSGDGSTHFPYETLDYALKSISQLKGQTNILYLRCDGNYSLNNCDAFGTYDSVYTIKGSCESKVTIKINGWKKFRCAISLYVKFENIIFDGSKQYTTCNDIEYCEYCSYNTYNKSDGYYYNDRNQSVSKNLPINNCNRNQNYYLGIFQIINSKLTLKNVEIKNFRFNYDSIIWGYGILKLFNVNFDNIQLYGSDKNAVIYHNTFWGDNFQLTYIKGSVKKLNNGYELDDPVDFRGFLYAAGFSSILIKDVEFKYNLVYRKPKSSLSSASLIYLKSIRSIEVNNCTFIYNYCETGIFNSNLEVSTYQTDYNETSHLTYLAQAHIYIHDSKFISNYGTLGVIHIEFLSKLLNIHLNNITFESNGVESDSLVYIYNPTILDEYKNETASNIVIYGKGTLNLILLPRWCKMASIEFKDNHALSIINATNLVNFDINDLLIESNGSPEEGKNVNTLLFDYFIKNRDTENLYISRGKSNVQSTDCSFMVRIEKPYNLKIIDITLRNNICRNSSPTFQIYNSDIRYLAYINCFDNIGYGPLPVCLHFVGFFDRNITNSNFIGNINYHKSGIGVFQIEGENNLYITNSSFINNSANLIPLYFSGKSIYINFSKFEFNKSIFGNGGGLHLILSSSIHIGSVIISSSNFTCNSVNVNGGAIFIKEKTVSLLKLQLLVSQTIFYGNHANSGSALYIDSSVILSQDSVIIGSKFIENESKMSGAISLYYYSGILSILSCSFIENTSQNMGAALHIDIPEDTQSLRSKAVIELSTFRRNIGDSIIYVDSINRNSSIETKKCLFEYNNGTIVSLNHDYFIDHGSIFQHNTAAFGSCFSLQNSAILYANSQFLNNTSDEYGGAVAMSFKSVFFCDNCIFIGNWVKKGKGGVLIAEQDSQFFLSNSSFIENSSGNDGSAIFAFNCNSTASSIDSSIFLRNHALGSGVIAFISSIVSILSSTIDNNSNEGYASGIKLTYSIAKISNSMFANQSSASGSFIYALAGSDVEIKNTTFYSGNSEESGGAIYSSESFILIDSSVFTGLSSQKGGAIYSAFESAITIKNSEFSDLKSSVIGGIINANQASLSIEDSRFDKFYMTGIYGKQLKMLNITNSEFRDGFGYNGGAIYCESCSNINIKLCTFDNNSVDLYGGALFLTSSGEINTIHNISACKFINNSAQSGGAINSDGMNLKISLSDFEQNRAISKQDKGEYGIGGGIRISCQNFQSCKFKIQSCYFTENTAKFNGGAVSWDDNLPEFINNLYENNVAEYGENIASYPVKLMQVNMDGSLEGYKNKKIADFVSNSSLTGIAPGQTVKNKLLVALVDNMNNIIRTDNRSEAELKSINLTTQISGKVKVKASRGIFNFSDFVISEEPRSEIQIIVTSSAIDTNKIKKSGETVFSKNITFDVKIRECKVGEVKSGKNCDVCPVGFYSLNPNLISCLSCPDVAECYGNYTIVPKPGYWRDNMYTDKFWKCPHPAACLGSPDKSNISLTGECGKVYKGNKCQSCQTGYVHTVENKCDKCPDKTNNIWMISGITLALIIVSFLIVKATRQSAFKPKSHLSIHIKIFLNYIQMAILASTFKLNWPDELLELFTIQLKSDYIHQQIYSLHCLFQNETSQDLVYFRTLIVTALMPVLMIILSLLFWMTFKKFKKTYETFWDDFISTCIILLFLIHSNIVQTMFASMNCTEINQGEYWLEIDLDVRCWNNSHLFYVFTISLPSIILWGIILPKICLVSLIRNKNQLDSISVRLRYGFLFNGYKIKHFYWEFIILYSKIILISCSVFLTRISIKLQALIVAILYTIYLHLQYVNSPYNESNLNQMEIRAKAVCVVTIYCGLFYIMGPLGNVASYFLFMLIVFTNFYFLIYWVWNLLKSILMKINQRIIDWKSKSKANDQLKDSNLKNESREDLENIFSKRINVSIASNENFLSESQALSLYKNEHYQSEEIKNDSEEVKQK